MKNLINFAFLTLFSFAFNFTAIAADGGNCNKNYFYETVKNGDTYSEGKDIYVKVIADNHYDIQSMTLYINGYKIRTEMNAPYEWGRPNGSGDQYLRNLQSGTYRLVCIARTKCGGKYKKAINFNVNQGSKPTDVISFRADKMNVLYIGVENPLTIESSNNNPLTISASDDNITIRKTGENKYMATAKKPGAFTINISSNGQTKVVPVRVKRIPNPVAVLSRKQGGAMGIGEFKGQSGVGAILENFDFYATCKIQGFELIWIRSGQAPMSSKNGGARFNAKSKRLVLNAKPGDIYIFKNVKSKCPGDEVSRELNTLTFFIK